MSLIKELNKLLDFTFSYELKSKIVSIAIKPRRQVLRENVIIVMKTEVIRIQCPSPCPCPNYCTDNVPCFLSVKSYVPYQCLKSNTSGKKLTRGTGCMDMIIRSTHPTIHKLAVVDALYCSQIDLWDTCVP